MSIKDELKAKLQAQRNSKSTIKERWNVTLEARKMIEEFIIPKFREISSKKPLSDYLEIAFHYNTGCWYYTSSINDLDNKRNSEYDVCVVSEAIKIAHTFDIVAVSTDDGSAGTTYLFTLDLR